MKLSIKAKESETYLQKFSVREAVLKETATGRLIFGKMKQDYLGRYKGVCCKDSDLDDPYASVDITNVSMDIATNQIGDPSTECIIVKAGESISFEPCTGIIRYNNKLFSIDIESVNVSTNYSMREDDILLFVGVLMIICLYNGFSSKESIIKCSTLMYPYFNEEIGLPIFKELVDYIHISN